VLRTHKFSLNSRPSALLLSATIVVSILAFAAPFLGKPSALFGFTPLPMSLLGAICAIVVGYIAATEAAKAWFFRRRTEP
jgi:Mg2+-importing ATPase